MTYNEVCDSLSAAGLACSRRHVNGLVSAGKLRVSRLSTHFVTFNPDQVRKFIVRELKKKGTK